MATLLPPDERFRRAVSSLLETPQPLRWARLADAVRAYLAATSAISADMTTTEVLRVLDRDEIATILKTGDIEKFSTDEVSRDDFEAIARRALELAA